MNKLLERENKKKLLSVPTPTSTNLFKTDLQQNQILQKNHLQEQQIKEEYDQSSEWGHLEDEEYEQKKAKIEKILNSETHKQRANQKMIVGSGFSMDVTEFFQFKKKELKGESAQSIFQEISGSRLAWIILLYSVVSTAMIPGWIMSIKANKLVRISWRFLMQFITVIPFVLYQYRTGNEDVRKKYSLSYIFDSKNLIKPFVSSLATSMWFTIILTGFQWTSVSHSIVMGSLSNFFLSLGRSRRKSNHDLESGGQILVIGGVILMLYDTCTYGYQQQITDYDYGVANTFYLGRKWWERMAFDLMSFMMSFFMSQFSKFTSDMGTYFPPFLSMFIINGLNCIIMAFSSYFVNACDWNFDYFWGMWSIFSSLHFAGFMFMALMLSLGQIISLVLITKLFPDPIIPALIMTLDPFIASLIIDFLGVQKLPGNFSIVGYVFLVPGICLILVGQCLYNRISAKRKADEQRSQELYRQLEQLKQIQEQQKLRKLRKAQKSNTSNKINEKDRSNL